jgi:hypothetical protein
MNALSIRKLFLIVVCLLTASVLIDFAHMVLSMIIDGVLAMAIFYFLWRIKGQYKTPLKELTRSRKFQQSALAGLWKSSGKSFLRKRMAGHMALMPRAVTR